MEKAEAALTDPDLLSMEREIAILDEWINEQMAGLDIGLSRELWEQARMLWGAVDGAIREADAIRMRTNLTALGELIDRGIADYKTWDTIFNAWERRKRFAESENKRRNQIGSTIQALEALEFAQRLLESVRRNVTDRDALQAITIDFARTYESVGGRRLIGPEAGGG